MVKKTIAKFEGGDRFGYISVGENLLRTDVKSLCKLLKAREDTVQIRLF